MNDTDRAAGRGNLPYKRRSSLQRMNDPTQPHRCAAVRRHALHLCAALFILVAGCFFGLEFGSAIGLCAAQGVRGWFACRKTITPPTNSYWEGRKHGVLYSRNGPVHTLAKRYASGALNMLDVGSYVPNIVASFDWIPNKVATDIQADQRMGWDAVRGVTFVRGDFLGVHFATLFDLITCTQVLEHFSDDLAKQFVRKMQSLCRPEHGLLVVSVPYEMPNTWIPCPGSGRKQRQVCKGHLQDPLGSDEFSSWFDQGVPGSIVSHVVHRGRVGVKGQETWANGTLIPANYQIIAWKRHAATPAGQKARGSNATVHRTKRQVLRRKVRHEHHK